MRLLLCGKKDESESIIEAVKALPLGLADYIIVDDYELIHQSIVDVNINTAIVYENGANGMECVYRIKESNCDIPIIWFSDDNNFAVQSYRLNCAYFGKKPITVEKLQKAFENINL